MVKGRISSAKYAFGFICVALWSTPSFAFMEQAWDYVKQSQLGFDYSNSIDRVDLSYDMPEGKRPTHYWRRLTY